MCIIPYDELLQTQMDEAIDAVSKILVLEQKFKAELLACFKAIAIFNVAILNLQCFFSQIRSDVESIASALTLEDRQKWKEIITTESTLRQELTEATIREDFEKIRKDEK